jgi:hypothetical protein
MHEDSPSVSDVDGRSHSNTVVGGSAGIILQASSIEGGVHFHEVPPVPPATRCTSPQPFGPSAGTTS